MNLGSLRSKQKQINRALQSIPLPRYNHKVVTQAQEQPQKHFNTINDNQSRQLKGVRKPSRGRYLTTQENQPKYQYKSLEMGSRGRKISHPKIQRESIQFEPYITKPVRKKISVHNIPVQQSFQDRHFLKSKRSCSRRRDPTETKQTIKQAMNQGNYKMALNLIGQQEEHFRQDMQFLQLKGVCLLKQQKYEPALDLLLKALVFDRKNRQIYIWCALCQNHLNRLDQAKKYLDECIRLFPEHFEAHYFRAKIQIKLKNYKSALQSLKTAEIFNPEKEEIKLTMAECQQYTGNLEGALAVYRENLGVPTKKNLKYNAKMGRILVTLGHEEEAEQLFERCIELTEKLGVQQYDDLLLECGYLLSLRYFKKGQFEKALMKGEWVLTAGKSKWAEPSIKVMMAARLSQRDFYAALNVTQRLQRLGFCRPNFGQLGLFCEGVILLMKKKASEAVVCLQTCFQMLQSIGETDLNACIGAVIHFLLGKDKEALEQLQLQQSVKCAQMYQKTTVYNKAITLGFMKYDERKYEEAAKHFEQALEVNDSKTDAKLYLAVTTFREILESLPRQGVQKQSTENSYKIDELKKKLDQTLTICCLDLEECNGNFSAYSFYYRGLYRAWNKDWNGATLDLDFSIDKSEDNFAKFFHLRGLCWGLLQNYKQAINDVSIALSIEPDDHECYLLRARCLQIEGDPTQAFNDLQTFISLRPDDLQIHKFAGHLLFQNGAFEDALQAYNQGQLDSKDTEVFLTKSKTHFLLGNFNEAAAAMLEAAYSDNENPFFLFDHQMMNFLGQLLSPYHKDKEEDKYVFDPFVLSQNLHKLKQIYESNISSKQLGKIFKLSQLSTLSGLIYFYQQEYKCACESFLQALELKFNSMMADADGDFEEDENQKKIFINQMYYNAALCQCMLKDYQQAEKFLKNCQINKELHTYNTFQELQKQISGEIPIEEEEEYLELFSLRNKISRFLPQVDIPFCCKGRESTRKMKICIPYPKVEPPDINPTFNMNFMSTVDLKMLDRRPQAPWILKENNAIKFTEKMEVYSKLSLGQSSVDNMRRPQLALGVSSDSDSMEFSLDLKQRLKLDDQVENKLRRLMKKQ